MEKNLLRRIASGKNNASRVWLFLVLILLGIAPILEAQAQTVPNGYATVPYTNTSEWSTPPTGWLLNGTGSSFSGDIGPAGTSRRHAKFDTGGDGINGSAGDNIIIAFDKDPGSINFYAATRYNTTTYPIWTDGLFVIEQSSDGLNYNSLPKMSLNSDKLNQPASNSTPYTLRLNKDTRYVRFRLATHGTSSPNAYVGLDNVTLQGSPEINVKQGVNTYLSGASTPYDFGSINLNSSSSVIDFTIENAGPGPLTITDRVTITGLDANQFELVKQPATSVLAGATTTFSVQFKPTVFSPAEKTAVLTIPNDDADESPYIIQIKGTVSQAFAINSFSPGLVRVGDVLTVYGSGFTEDFGVFFQDENGNPVYAIANEYVSSTEALTVVPFGAVTGKITMVNEQGEAVSTDELIVYTINSFSPGSGVAGDVITINGSGFLPDFGVFFKDKDGREVYALANEYVSPTQVRTVVPAGAVSGVITMVNENDIVESNEPFIINPPTIISLSPNTGRRGDEITVKGQNLIDITSITVNGAQAKFSYSEINTVVLTVPTEASTGNGLIVVTTTGGSDDAEFTVLESAPLPVELVEFTGKSNAKGITLTWKTASEQGNSHFEVQASQNPAKEEFRTIQKVDSKVTNSATVTSYEALDAKAAKGVVTYYRLKQVDLDGAFEYSKTIAVKNIGSVNTPIQVKAYPNPFGADQNLNIRVEAEKAGNMTVVLYYVTGKKALEKVYSVESGVSYIELDLSNISLSKGMYILSTELNGEVTSTRVVKQ